MIGDEKGIAPSNVDQGYILRRLIRRAIRFAKQIGLTEPLSRVAEVVVGEYGDDYPEMRMNAARITEELDREQERFEKTLINGMREFEKLCHYLVGDTVSGKAAFKLYDTYGFPIEMTTELAAERGLKVNVEGFRAAFAEPPAEEPRRRRAEVQGRPGRSYRGHRAAAHGHASHAPRAQNRPA